MSWNLNFTWFLRQRSWVWTPSGGNMYITGLSFEVFPSIMLLNTYKRDCRSWRLYPNNNSMLSWLAKRISSMSGMEGKLYGVIHKTLFCQSPVKNVCLFIDEFHGLIPCPIIIRKWASTHAFDVASSWEPARDSYCSYTGRILLSMPYDTIFYLIYISNKHMIIKLFYRDCWQVLTMVSTPAHIHTDRDLS